MISKTSRIDCIQMEYNVRVLNQHVLLVDLCAFFFGMDVMRKQ